ncbi:hypothetical protein [Leptospira sp. severe_002]|uniref:hypothetical protein n=1 Tax=Leptospira sp. severe_002 TaxID=2838237 RepID=UPI001E5F9302|nr:hypothetical protein [Leptospira sp. severe_002]
MLENPRKDVARPQDVNELVKLASCCFRHAKIATKREVAANLREIGEGLLKEARKLDPEVKRPE